MLGRVTIALIIIQITLSKCDKGCLKCSSSDQCLYCDISENYILQSGSCDKIEIENCSIINLAGNCVQCEKFYYSDANTGKCIKVLDDDLIPNCIYYYAKNVCKTCTNGFYASEGRCIAVTTEIDGCEIYNGPNKCEKCVIGSVLSLNGDICHTSISIPNCATYTFFKCDMCHEDYARDENYYFQNRYKFRSQENMEGVSFVFRILTQRLNIIDKKEECFLRWIPNCSIYTNATKCQSCNEGYLLTEKGECQAYPSPIIANCEIYNSDTVCRKCKDGFILQSANKCIASEKILNCAEHDGSKDYQRCIKCDTMYYLDANSCVKRAEVVENCQKYEDFADRCIECINGYIPTDDGLKCLVAKSNCKSHQLGTNKDTEDLVCAECNDEYFISNDKLNCILGTIDFCLTYDQGKENSCLVCKNGYYLDTLGNCKQHDELPGCEVYNGLRRNRCKKCATGLYNFTSITSCNSVTNTITNCIHYSDAKTCDACQPGFYLSENQCIEIPVDLNCDIYDGVSCLSCDENYVLEHGVCIKPPQYKSNGCYENNTQNLDYNNVSSAEFNCLKCKPFYMPYQMKNAYQCVSREILVNPVSNCVKYQDDTCSKCADGYFLYDDSCVTTCEGSVQKATYLLSNNHSSIEISKRDVCTNKIDCSIEALNIASLGSKLENICVKCPNTFISVVDLESDDFALTNKLVASAIAPISEYPKLTCIDYEEYNILGNLTNGLVDSCEYYAFDNEDQIGCVKCKLGFTGAVINGSGEEGFIEHCVRDINCKTDYYEGVPLNFSKLVSCHACDHTHNIPFIGVSAGSTLTYEFRLKPYKIQDGSWTAETGDNAVQCLGPYRGVFYISPDEDNFSFPDNCGIGAINVDSEKNAASSTTSQLNGGDKTKMSLFCVVCKPGYRSTPFSVDIPVAIKCDAIAFCSSSTWFNNCTFCKEGYAYGYKTGQGILYNHCQISDSEPNCYALNIDDQYNSYCAYCKKGYILNQNNNCERLTPSLCETGNFQYVVDLPLNEYGYFLYNFEDGFGCSECKSDSYMTKQTNPEILCLESNFLQQLDTDIDHFTFGCLNYGIVDNEVKCLACESSHILTTTNKCVESKNIDGCIIALTDDRCQICDKGYVIFRGKCYKAHIQNCKVYSESLSEDEQVCNTCEDGYYLANNRCKTGTITGCKTYDNQDDPSCSTCQVGYIPVKTLGIIYCYPIPSDLHCEQLSDEFSSQKFICKKCKADYYLMLSNDELEKDICIPFNEIEKCVEYNTSEQLAESSFSCKRCSNGYYSQINQCLVRKIVNDNCIEYAENADVCLKCPSGYHPDSSFGCKQNPNGIRGCRIYKSSVECIACDENQYLQENDCIDIEPSLRIENCQYYSDLNTCSKCLNGHLLENNECIESIAKNCLTQTDINTCTSCPKKHGLQTSAEITNCVPVEIQNCIKHSEEFPFRCLVCEKEFYPNNKGGCNRVNSRIGNCLYYESNIHCIQCLKGFVLSKDKRSCESRYSKYLDPNCNSYKQLNNPICAQCNYGYYFKDGHCLSCTNNSIGNGCFTCNPYNENECLMCRSYFYMNNEGKCISSLTANDGGDLPNKSIVFNALWIFLACVYFDILK